MQSMDKQRTMMRYITDIVQNILWCGAFVLGFSLLAFLLLFARLPAMP